MTVMLCPLVLDPPNEPSELRREMRTLLEHCPDYGWQLLLDGDWIANPLWEIWQEALEHHGVGREHLQPIVAAYRNELRLWVMGERPWEHCIAGLIGRISRRVWAIGR